jgi:lipid II:glycine glycyltransferase (peptidoglycan interpeptide bridge formation enzyme)
MRLQVEPAQRCQLDLNFELLQSGFWAAFRADLGWDTAAFRCRLRETEFFLSVLIRTLPGGLRLAYVPHGPELAEPLEGTEEFLAELGRALGRYLPRCLFLRYDLPWGREGEGVFPPALSGGSLVRAPMDIQPPSTVVLALGVPEGAILDGMKPKTRYNIRLAERRGVEVSEASASELPEWYALYRETALRDRITLHSEGYYRRLFSLADSYGPGAPELCLLLARHDGELLGGVIVALRGKGSWYLYGASSTARRNLMSTYALQWKAIRIARDRGCRSYDLFGIPPSGEPGHPMHGLWRFKTGFGGSILNRYGCWDLPFSSVAYRGYRGAEALRSWYYRNFRKRLARGRQGREG